MHISEAVLHEYLDRGADADAMTDVVTHLDECADCRALLDSVRKERSAASLILRAAVPAGLPRPSFESLLPRPTFDTLEGAHSTDVVFPEHQLQFKQVTMGLRGQAIALIWAATVILALGVGWFASELYQQEAAHNTRVSDVQDSIAKTGSTIGIDSTAMAPISRPDSGALAKTTFATKAQDDGARVANAASLNSGTEPSSLAGVTTPPATPESPIVLPTQTTITRFEMHAADGSTRPVVGGKAAADKPLRSTELVGTMNLDSYPDTLTASVLGPREEWRPIRADSALTLLGGKMIRARGLNVIDYAVSTYGVAPRVRVRQHIERHDTLEIYQSAPRSPERAATPEQLTSRATRDASQTGAFQHVAGGSYFRRFYATMRSPDDRIVTVIAGKAQLVNQWTPELTSLAHD